ncbi:hypothetical protein [Streptomyces sp. CB00072]|uniref:hypothetical protein n=1 Tax=Streptomyces sp. CB00072 TaxID=1703928 RepID=UPI0011611F2F|nr:hypothetical protein [Streptomyces sp. CB00072]
MDEQLAQHLRDQQSGGPTTAWPHGKPMPNGETSGRSVSKQPVHPDSNRNPPFTVVTSMPSKS